MSVNSNEFQVVDAPAPLPHNVSEGSVLKQSQTKQKDNSYYYAHTRNFEIPPEAKVIKGPGLITGGFPEKLTESPVSPSVMVPATSLSQWSYMDDGSKVRLYIFKEQIPDANLDLKQDCCKLALTERSFNLEVTGSRGQLYRLKFDNLTGAIDEEKSVMRVSAQKISVTLQKKDPEQKWANIHVKSA